MGSEETEGKPRFEPPPWEREAFEALAARRAEEQAALDALAAAARAREEAAPKAAADPWDEVPNDPVSSPAPGEAGADASAVAGPGAGETPNVQERVADAMLLQLRSEERSDGKATALVGRVASVVTAVLGSGMFVAGVAMLQKTNGKMIAVVGSLVLSVFGMIFVGMAVWVWISTSRSRGR